MADDELLVFVREALARQIPRPEVERVLRSAGWTTDQTRAALAAFADVEFPLPVPRARPYLSAREAFLYLVLFGTLYLSAYNLGSLVFDLINWTFPDLTRVVADYDSYIRNRIRWSVSMLIVAFPVFLYMSWITSREVRTEPTKRASRVRRWLTYLTLFVAAIALIGDVTTLIYNLLGGELSTRFVLKVATVALIAGTAFWYYLHDLRLDERESR